MNENHQPLILVVDDNEKNIQVLGTLLRNNNYRIAVAISGRQALEYVQQTIPEIILLDVMMPEMDGIEVCRRLRGSGRTSGIPILFLTSLTDTESKLLAFDAGGDDYLTKPFSHQEVLARVKVFLERSQAQAKLLQSREELKELNRLLEEKVKSRTEHIQKMQSQLMMQEKMASLGILAAGIAHELNNPVNFVYTNFATLKDNFDDIKEIVTDYKDIISTAGLSEEGRRKVEQLRVKEEKLRFEFVLQDLDDLFKESQEGFNRISSIIRSMRNFSRGNLEDEAIAVDLNRIIEETIVIARNEYKNYCRVETTFEELPVVFCVPQLIGEVVLNLLMNAIHAIKDAVPTGEGVISIRTFTSGSKVCCDISDNGPGISKPLRTRIFEHFFTTKDIGKGTGLGLSISYGIMKEKHQGSLELVENEAQGSLFRFCLPSTLDGEND
jgi:two-component system NtrC family sensor kinase